MAAGIQTKQVNVSAAGDNTVVAAVGAGTDQAKRITVLGYLISAQAGLNTVQWKDGAATVIGGPYDLAADEEIGRHGGRENPVFRTSPGNALILNLSAATAVTGEITFMEEQ